MQTKSLWLTPKLFCLCLIEIIIFRLFFELSAASSPTASSPQPLPLPTRSHSPIHQPRSPRHRSLDVSGTTCQSSGSHQSGKQPNRRRNSSHPINQHKFGCRFDAERTVSVRHEYLVKVEARLNVVLC